MSVTVQMQSIIYHNEKEKLMRALQGLANAVRVNRETTGEVENVIVRYGDVSSVPVFSEAELHAIDAEFGSYFSFHYTYLGDKTGTLMGHNLLSRNCNCDYMVVMRPEVIVCPRFFSKMLIPFLDKSKNAGMVEARQTPVENPKEYDRQTFETDWVTRACFMIPTEIYRLIGGFDAENFTLECADADLSWRVRLLDKKLYYRPDCTVFSASRFTSDANLKFEKIDDVIRKKETMFLAYKWSCADHFQMLYDQLAEDEHGGKDVIAEFERLKEENKLPTRLDSAHQIARFVGENFSESRFFL